MTKPVLVVHGDNLIGLAVTRGLGRMGIPVVLFSSPRGVSRPSRYVKKYFPLPPMEGLAAQALQVVERYGITHVFCTSENFIEALNSRRKELEAIATLMFAPAETFRLALDKTVSLSLAAKCGLITPNSAHVTSLAEARVALQEFPGSIVLKYPKGPGAWTADRPDCSFKARHFATSALAEEWFTATSSKLEEYPIIQEFIPGWGVGVELLVREGRLLAAFQHRRLREYPPEGGGSCYCVGEPLSEALLAQSLKLLREMKWDGVAMVEYRFDPTTSRHVFMEVNGRFWGSLPLASHSGVNFPHLWYESTIDNSTLCRPVVYGRTGVRCRAVAGDTLWLARAMLSNHQAAWRHLVEYLWSFRPGTKYFLWGADDPCPTVMKALYRFWR